MNPDGRAAVAREVVRRVQHGRPAKVVILMRRVRLAAVRPLPRRAPLRPARCPKVHSGMENHAADLASSMSGVPEHLAGSQVVAYLSELYAALNSGEPLLALVRGSGRCSLCAGFGWKEGGQGG